MKFNLFMSLVMAVLLSIVTSKIVYFGFTPNYAADIFSRQAFNGRFDHDVYKYRILCKYLLFAVDDYLAKDMPEKGAEQRILINTPGGSERFYLAFYYLNAFFLSLTSIMIVLILGLKKYFVISEIEKNLVIFLIPLLIGLSQFVVCCYDVSSYFFQLLILYIFLRFNTRQYWISIVGMAAIVFLSTLNRESAALSVSMIILLLITMYGISNKVLISCFIIAACFLLTYTALRYLILDSSHILVINHDAGQILLNTNIIGLLFWGIFFYLPIATASTVENKFLITTFFLFCVPYIITCLKDGVLWEIRLYIPLFIGSIFLSKFKIPLNIFQQSILKKKIFK